jgi:hypothetical protein
MATIGSVPETRPKRPVRQSHEERQAMSAPEFPEQGILWRGWNEETLRIINEKEKPVLLFVADGDPTVWPFLREIFKEMPGNARLRTLLHDVYPALFIKADELPGELKLLGAGSRYHIAVLSPYGLTPIVTFDAVTGRPSELVAEIAAVLERLKDAWS